MQRLSIARVLRLALVGLTVTLAVIAAVGVAGLYNARQQYENTLVDSSQLASAAANLATASVVVEEVAANVHGRYSAADRQTAEAYQQAQQRARVLAASDPLSLRLVDAEINAHSANQALSVAGKIQSHQTLRQQSARADARSKSRRALLLVIVAGMIALAGALGLVALLIRSMRRPLDSLVAATQAMASGDLERRVVPDGPQELRQLSESFNLMGDELQAATGRIERERSKLATTIASLGDALIVTEPGSSVIAMANPRAAELVPELVPGSRADAEGSPLPGVAELGKAERTVEHGGRTLVVTADAVGGADHGEGTVWTIRDMTEWARLDRAKSEFIATASHELRSPLTSIKGFVELLATQPAGMSERQLEFVSIILRSTDRLVELVNDLLDVARLEADQVSMTLRAVDVGEVLNELSEMMGPRVEAKHQSLGVAVPASLPLAMADPGRVRQIVQNLLTNAHLYTPEGGRLQLSADAREGTVRISIADTGPGMTQVQLDHIFERFYRAQDDHSSPGTGLGLAIVKSLIDLHDGKIEVASEVGRGTTFRVSIPVATGELPGLTPALDALRGRRVLIVDDEAEIADLIADQLAPYEVITTIALSGAQALELMHQQRFDAVTMDVRMPEMTGIELLATIRADPKLASTPVVFVSVFANMTQLSGEWIVSKPIDPNELRDVLGTAVSLGRSRVLVVARDDLRDRLEPALQQLEIAHQWETSGIGAAQACSERRFEVALIDVGLSNPQAVLQALNLRGRRMRRAVILISNGNEPPPPGIERLGLQVVPVSVAGGALVEALRPVATGAAGGWATGEKSEPDR
jgi:signal transduction histidine kinase/DNA-binding response OmpR family regulator